MKKKSLLFLLIFCMLLFIFSGCKPNNYESNTPNNYESNTETRKDAFVGEGTKEKPYVIESKYNLLFLEEEVNVRNQQYSEKYFIQTKDIDMMGYCWTPLGHSEKTAFKGNYNGCGKTIQNINIKVSNNGYVGFWGYCQNGIIENISLKAVTIDCYIGKNVSSAGLLIGYGNQCTLLNCKTEGIIDIESYKAEANIGGVIGSAFFCYPYGTHTRIVSCESVVTIVSNSPLPNIGGIAGRATNYDISDCVAKTVITYNEIMRHGSGGSYSGIGGLVGVNLQGVINNSNIELETYSISDIKIGAIVGLSEAGKIEDCSATINSTSTNVKLSIVAFDANKEKPKNCDYILKEN